MSVGSGSWQKLKRTIFRVHFYSKIGWIPHNNAVTDILIIGFLCRDRQVCNFPRRVIWLSKRSVSGTKQFVSKSPIIKTMCSSQPILLALDGILISLSWWRKISCWWASRKWANVLGTNCVAVWERWNTCKSDKTGPTVTSMTEWHVSRSNRVISSRYIVMQRFPKIVIS